MYSNPHRRKHKWEEKAILEGAHTNDAYSVCFLKLNWFVLGFSKKLHNIKYLQWHIQLLPNIWSLYPIIRQHQLDAPI